MRKTKIPQNGEGLAFFYEGNKKDKKAYAINVDSIGLLKIK
jgi:hypothetical protein